MSALSTSSPGGSSARQAKILLPVLVIHAVLILGPLALGLVSDFFAPPKVNAFRVKIGGRELSHAPVVGMPERTRPDGREASKPAPSEPRVQPKPKPKPKPKPEPVTPKVAPKPKPKPVKPEPKVAKPTPKTPVKNPPKTTPKATPKTAAQTTPKPSKSSDAQSQVYQGGGTNYNPNVPIGTRNTGQERGKQDNRTPGGGRDAALTRYMENAGRYLKTRWIAPPRSLLGDRLPEVLIELEIAADGRVRGKRIIRASGSGAMDESVKRMLDVLDRIPAPPSAMTLQFIMRPEE